MSRRRRRPRCRSRIEMGARQYSPLLGRFLEVDHILSGLDTNDYSYVRDPINQSDLTGNGGPCSLSPRNPNAWNRCSLRRARERGQSRRAKGSFRRVDVRVWVAPSYWRTSEYRLAGVNRRAELPEKRRIVVSKRTIDNLVSYGPLIVMDRVLPPWFQLPGSGDLPSLCRPYSGTA